MNYQRLCSRCCGWHLAKIMALSALLALSALAGAAQSADGPVILDTGEISLGEHTRPVAGIEPSGVRWKERWQEALDLTDWDFEPVEAGWVIRHEHFDFARFVLAMDAAVITRDADPELVDFHQTLNSGIELANASESKLAFSIDGSLYSPVTMANYNPSNGMFIILSSRSTYCMSAGNPTSNPSAHVVAIINNQIVRLNGSSGVSPAVYKPNTGVIHLQSQVADTMCGEPDDIRFTMHAPSRIEPGQPTQWTILATNHSSQTIHDITFAAEWAGNVQVYPPAGCTWTNNILSCSRSSLSPNGEWETRVNVTAQHGDLLGYCEGAAASATNVSSDNCWSSATVSERVSIGVERQGPHQAESGTPFIWEITVSNDGWGTAENVELVDVTLPGANIDFISAKNGAECSATRPAGRISISCHLEESLEPGEEQTIQLVMRAQSPGNYSVQCSVYWQGGQDSSPSGCSTLLSVVKGDTIFKSRFEPQGAD